jgi:hypothetical protein
MSITKITRTYANNLKKLSIAGPIFIGYHRGIPSEHIYIARGGYFLNSRKNWMNPIKRSLGMNKNIFDCFTSVKLTNRLVSGNYSEDMNQDINDKNFKGFSFGFLENCIRKDAWLFLSCSVNEIDNVNTLLMEGDRERLGIPITGDNNNNDNKNNDNKNNDNKDNKNNDNKNNDNKNNDNNFSDDNTNKNKIDNAIKAEFFRNNPVNNQVNNKVINKLNTFKNEPFTYPIISNPKEGYDMKEFVKGRILIKFVKEKDLIKNTHSLYQYGDGFANITDEAFPLDDIFISTNISPGFTNKLRNPVWDTRDNTPHNEFSELMALISKEEVEVLTRMIDVQANNLCKNTNEKQICRNVAAFFLTPDLSSPLHDPKNFQKLHKIYKIFTTTDVNENAGNTKNNFVQCVIGKLETDEGKRFAFLKELQINGKEKILNNFHRKAMEIFNKDKTKKYKDILIGLIKLDVKQEILGENIVNVDELKKFLIEIINACIDKEYVPSNKNKGKGNKNK